MKKIGILGGMGPAASAALYSRMLTYCQTKYGAVQDNEYPPIMLYSITLQGFDETGITNIPLVLKQLLQGIKMLEMSQCDFIIIPCNTVHVFINELRLYADVPVLSIIEEVVGKVATDHHQNILLLGSETTLSQGIYQQALQEKNIKYLEPPKENYYLITSLILDVMRGNIQPKNKKDILHLIHSKNPSAVILGCTELPLAISSTDIPIPLYDSLQILAESAVEYALENKNFNTFQKTAAENLKSLAPRIKHILTV